MYPLIIVKQPLVNIGYWKNGTSNLRIVWVILSNLILEYVWISFLTPENLFLLMSSSSSSSLSLKEFFQDCWYCVFFFRFLVSHYYKSFMFIYHGLILFIFIHWETPWTILSISPVYIAFCIFDFHPWYCSSLKYGGLVVDSTFCTSIGAVIYVLSRCYPFMKELTLITIVSLLWPTAF